MEILQEWAKKAAENACQLALEANLLQSHGHLARAYYLAHMSAEESAKAIVLAGAHTMGLSDIDLPEVTRLLQNHKKKIEFTVRIAAESSPELAERLAEKESTLIDHINHLKNDTMYTSHSNGAVQTPGDKISDIDVGTHVALAASWSELALKLCSAS